MEKSRSIPAFSYSSSNSGGFGYEGRSNSYSFNGPSGGDDCFASSSDPELKRKRRVAAYNVFTTEAKLKSSVRNSFKWIKSKFTNIRSGL